MFWAVQQLKKLAALPDLTPASTSTSPEPATGHLISASLAVLMCKMP